MGGRWVRKRWWVKMRMGEDEDEGGQRRRMSKEEGGGFVYCSLVGWCVEDACMMDGWMDN